MRHIAIVLLVACGSPSAQPAYDDGRFANSPAFNRRRDAGVIDGAAETFRSVTAPPDAAVSQVPTQSVSDALKAEGAEVEGAVAETEDPPLPDNVTIEDGVPVIRTPMRAWCGRLTCWPREPFCKEKNKGKACTRVDNYACFKLTTRTNGEPMTFCMATYGECEKFSDILATEAETKEVGNCYIMRYDAKAKK